MELGRPLIILGGTLLALGLLLTFGGKLGLGRLPGDIQISTRFGGVYFPVVTCIVLSIVLTVIGGFFSRR